MARARTQLLRTAHAGSCANLAAVSEPTEDEHRAAERLTDQVVGLYLLTTVCLVTIAGVLSAVTDLPMVLVGLPIIGGGLALFLRWSSRKTDGLPAQRQTVRPVRWRWVAKRLAVATVVVLAVVSALLSLS